MYNFAVQMADVDRGVYEDVALRAARHPSETDAYMMTRVLAYCLEYVEGITFSDGISSTDEPGGLVRDLTGRLTTSIEVGVPSWSEDQRRPTLTERYSLLSCFVFDLRALNRDETRPPTNPAVPATAPPTPFAAVTA